MLAGCASTAPSPEVKSQLAPTGELRVAVLTSNPIIHRTTPGLGRELAAQAGVPAKLIDYGAVNKLMEDATKGAWDVAVVAIDPERRALVDFAPAHLVADGFLTVLVPPGSSARRMADIDQPGMRVAAVRGAATQMVLSRTLKNATVLAAENEDAAFASMKEGKAQGCRRHDQQDLGGVDCEIHHSASLMRRSSSSLSLSVRRPSLTRWSSSGREAPSKTRLTNSRTIDVMTARSGCAAR